MTNDQQKPLKVGFYQDHRKAGLGGSEYCLGILAGAIAAEGHAVELVHHDDKGFVERLADCFGLDLVGVSERILPLPGRWDVPGSSAWGHRSALRNWMREASEPYDLFVCITHAPPPFCHARAGFLYVLFPMEDPRYMNGLDTMTRRLGGVKRWLRRRLYYSLWKERIASYDSIVPISEFAAKWTHEYWGVNGPVIYPPVAVDEFAPGPKENRVLTLGRFTPLKKQAELVAAFRRHKDRLPGWSMACLGSTSAREADQKYLGLVQQEAVGCAEIIANAPRERLRDELSRGRVFWHAMGIDVDEMKQPALIEHFGIATVEAMAAGCVPVVVNRGGQREIVTHGETGFLCSSIDEFAERTIELAADPRRLNRMAAAAQDRAKEFARPVFVERMMALLRPHLGGPPVSEPGPAVELTHGRG
jgi:glycosyltransferase involved in cell wall biosynthesis